MSSTNQQTMTPNRDEKNYTGIAGRAPFDILCQVFEYYGKTETGSFPLETLLKVCKTWSEVAQRHTRLWSNFRIALGDLQSMVLWSNLVHYRLNRCTPNTLYDIEIVEEPSSDAPEIAVQVFNRILSLLTGNSGELAYRWRRFKANHHLIDRSNLAECLSFPTPNLVEIDLKYLRTGYHTRPILPEAPSLRTFRSIYSYMAIAPDISMVTELEIDPEEWTEEAVAGAVNLVKLTMIGLQYRLQTWAKTYPALTTLELSWMTLDWGYMEIETFEGLGEFAAPALRHLTLGVAAGIDFDLVVKCRGLPLNLVEEVHISAMDSLTDVEDALAHLADGLRRFLRELTGTRALGLEGPLIASFALKILAEECDDLFLDPIPRLKIAGMETELGSGGDRIRSIQELRYALDGNALEWGNGRGRTTNINEFQGTGNVVDGVWDDLYEHFDFMRFVT